MTNSITNATSGTGWDVVGNGIYYNPNITLDVVSYDKYGSKTKISPILYFKYVKSKFGILEGRKVQKRLEDLERAFDEAVEAGQKVLAEKFLNSLSKEAREATLIAKGIKFFIEKDDLYKYKMNLRDGHISDTRFEAYTRIVPKRVLNVKKKFDEFFDDFIVFHYYNEEVQKDVKKMSSDEKSKMRDPVLFGTIKETNRFYFVADWEDEFCDLTFDEMVKTMSKEKGSTVKQTFSKKVQL